MAMHIANTQNRAKAARYNRAMWELNAICGRQLVDLGLNSNETRQVALKASFGI